MANVPFRGPTMSTTSEDGTSTTSTTMDDAAAKSNKLTCVGLAAYAWMKSTFGNDIDWSNSKGATVTTADNVEADPSQLFASLFPDFGIEVGVSEPSQGVFHATLLFYGFGWSSTSWPFARVFGHAECEGDDDTDDDSSGDDGSGQQGQVARSEGRCCEVAQVNAPTDFGGGFGDAEISVCGRLKWADTGDLREQVCSVCAL